MAKSKICQHWNMFEKTKYIYSHMEIFQLYIYTINVKTMSAFTKVCKFITF